MEGGSSSAPNSENASLGLMPLTEGVVHLLVSSKDHPSVQSSPCVSCGQGVIDALLFSITLEGQIFVQVVFQQLGKKDRGEVGRQMVFPLAEEACSVDFPCNT